VSIPQFKLPNVSRRPGVTSKIASCERGVVVIFEENDVGASVYSKKKRPDFQRLIELI
jgi:hypothetical protein